MSVPSNLSFGAIFRSVWGGMVEVFRSHFFFSLAGLAVFTFVGRAQAGWAADNAELQLALDALSSILLLPVQIVIYRFLILREDGSTNAWANSPPRMLRMVGWTIVLWVFMSVLPYLTKLLESTWANMIATVAGWVVAIVLLVRFAILFPAIAVDAPGATLGNVWADTKGRIWLIVKTALIASLPLLAVGIAAGAIGDSVKVPDRLGTLGDSTYEFLATILFTVVAARLFDWIGHQVKGLPAEPGSAPLAGQSPPVG